MTHEVLEVYWLQFWSFKCGNNFLLSELFLLPSLSQSQIKTYRVLNWTIFWRHAEHPASTKHWTESRWWMSAGLTFGKKNTIELTDRSKMKQSQGFHLTISAEISWNLICRWLTTENRPHVCRSDCWTHQTSQTISCCLIVSDLFLRQSETAARSEESVKNNLKTNKTKRNRDVPKRFTCFHFKVWRRN